MPTRTRHPSVEPRGERMASRRRARDRARRRRGQAADAADRRPRQAGRAVRRAVPAGRLRAVQPGQRRLPADVRADAVQVALARPAHHDDLADVDAARQLRHARCPAQQRLGPAVVHRQRRRDLPEPQPRLRRGARLRRRLRRRPRLPHGPVADGRASTSRPAPGSPSPASGCPRRRPTAFGVIETGRTAATSTAFLEKPADPPGLPDDPDDGVRLDGQLRVLAPRR